MIVIDGVEERLALAKDFGADDLVDLRECTTPAARIERVLELTERWGADVVMELVGNPNVVDEGLRMTAPEGAYLEVAIGDLALYWFGFVFCYLEIGALRRVHAEPLVDDVGVAEQLHHHVGAPAAR